MIIPVRPSSSLQTALLTIVSVAGSRRDDASSSITRSGSLRKTRAMATSCASPAESCAPPPARSVSSPSPRDSTQGSSPSSARARSTVESSTVSSKRVMLSLSVPRNSCTSCVTMPRRLRSASSPMPPTGTPPIRTAPRCASYRRNISRDIVVLPLPVRPSKPSTFPGRRSNDTSSSTQLLPWYANWTSSNSTDRGPEGGVLRPSSRIDGCTSSMSRTLWMLAPAMFRSSTSRETCWMSPRSRSAYSMTIITVPAEIASPRTR